MLSIGVTLKLLLIQLLAQEIGSQCPFAGGMFEESDVSPKKLLKTLESFGQVYENYVNSHSYDTYETECHR